ncbi:MAG: hypothetical protein LBT29_02910 [Flavobacteriaceae bacterium]|nr:hypothetical protein [Flavobacteriaceae bacterium]
MKKTVILWNLLVFSAVFSQEKTLYFNRNDQITTNKDSVFYTRTYSFDETQKVWNVVDVFDSGSYRKGNSTTDPATGIAGHFAYFNYYKEKISFFLLSITRNFQTTLKNNSKKQYTQ